MNQGSVSLSKDARGVATVTVDRQAKINVVDSRMIDALREKFAQIAADESVRVAVLTGAGEKAFIGGADIAEMAALDKPKAKAFITNLHELCEAIRTLPVPVVARIRGYCLGGGLEVAAACDLRVATPEAKFSMPEVRVGIPSIIEAALLPQLIGWGRTREMLFTGDIYDAATAEKWGLVERVVPPEELDGFVEKWIESILACGPSAIRQQKRIIRRWEQHFVSEAIALGIDEFATAYEGSEPHERMQAFLESKKK